MKSKLFFLVFFISFIYCFAESSSLDGFVLIKGGEFFSGDVAVNKNRSLVRVDDFEILDHPVTNQEFKCFIDATGHPAPLHWKNGQIPADKDNFPVIYVNRHDVDAYLNWISEIEGRIYR